MSAPRSIELDEGITAAVRDQLLEVLAHSNLDWAVVVLRDGFGLDEGLQFTVNHVLGEGQQVFDAVRRGKTC